MNKILLSLALVSALFIISGCSDNNKAASSAPQVSSTATDNTKAIKQAAPDFTYTDLNTGKQVKLSDLRGKPVFLNFWATWCPPCVGEMPHIQAAYEANKNKMHFIAISVDDNKEEPVKFTKDKGYTLPIGYGNVDDINKKYNLEAIPASYLIDADGHIKAQVVGAMNETALADFLKQAQ